jgi:hypothetical protein
MNQKIVIVDNFYDVAHQYHKSFFEKKSLVTNETIEKISYILNSNVEVLESFNEVSFEGTNNSITANTFCDWIAVIYLTMPANCIFNQGLGFYIHKKTKLETFPDEYARKLYGLSSIEDIKQTFNVNDYSEWKEYSNIFLKYNRLVLFKGDLWHSYGSGFGNELNNSMIYQKILLKNV